MRIAVSLLGVEVFAISTDSDTTTTGGPDGDVTTYPMGFVARMDTPHEAETPDRDW